MKPKASVDWILLAATAFVSLVLAFGVPLLSGYRFLRYGGYYGMAIVLILFCLFGLVFWRRFRRSMPKSPPGFRTVSLALLVFQIILLWLTPDAFRVMDDEAVLLNTALSLHEERELFAATEGYWIEGDFEILSGNLDKRPFLYGFLLSLVHDAFGYRIENAFLLNAGLSLLAGFLGIRLLASSCGALPALVAMLALVSTPAFLSAANGAGFEMLNFALVALLALAVRHFIRAKEPLAALPVCCVAVLLAYARYESVFFILPVGMLLLIYRFGREKQPLHPGIALMPVLLVPYVWLYRCTLARVGAWARAEAESLPVFSLQYIPGNVVDAVRYFFSLEEMSEGNPVLIYGGMLGLGMIAWQFFRGSRAKFPTKEGRPGIELVFWIGFYATLTAVLMTYFWSSFMDVMSQRMALPFFWVFTFGLAWVLSQCLRLKGRATLLAPILVAGCILVSAPLHVRAVQGKFERNGLARVQTKKWEWSKGLSASEQELLIIDNNPAVWTALRVPAIQWPVGDRGLEQALEYSLRESIDVIYVVQVANRAGTNEPWVVTQGQRLDDSFPVSKPELVLQLTPQTRVTISRLLKLRP